MRFQRWPWRSCRWLQHAIQRRLTKSNFWSGGTLPSHHGRQGVFLNRCVWYAGVSPFFHHTVHFWDFYFNHMFQWNSKNWSWNTISSFNWLLICFVIITDWGCSTRILWGCCKARQHSYQHVCSLEARDVTGIFGRLEEEDLGSRLPGTIERC